MRKLGQVALRFQTPAIDRLVEPGHQLPNFVADAGIFSLKIISIKMDMADDFNFVIKVIKGEQGIDKLPASLWNTIATPLRPRQMFKRSDGLIALIPNCTADKARQVRQAYRTVVA